MSGRRSRPRFLALTAALGCGLMLAACGGAEAPADSEAPAGDAAAAECGPGGGSLEGETVRLVVGTDPGGGYDAYARMIAPYMADELGAEVVVENQPGAGGLLAINSMLAGETDGTHLLILNGTGNVSSQIAGVEGAGFDLAALSWIGRLSSEPELVTVAADGPYETWDDVLAAAEEQTIQIGTTGLGSAAYINGAIVDRIYELNGELIAGYASASEAELGLIAGDIDVFPGNFDSRIKSIEAGDSAAVLTLDEERIEELPDTPTIFESEDLSEEDLELLEAHSNLTEMGRPVVSHPDTPEDVVAELRTALRCVVEDEELLAESEEIGRPITYLSGEEIEQVALELADPPQAYREFLVSAYGG
jgi:tripartite-type tricarboxylate transporter receptor subunit TctC